MDEVLTALCSQQQDPCQRGFNSALTTAAHNFQKYHQRYLLQRLCKSLIPDNALSSGCLKRLWAICIASYFVKGHLCKVGC